MAIFQKNSPREFVGLESDKPADGDLREGETFYATDSDIIYIADGSGVLTPTIRPYKIYTALLSQAGTAAPTVTILENSIGTIVWARTGVGVYTATLAGAFTDAKTSASINNSPAGNIVRTDINTITVNTFDGVPAAADAILLDTLVEIRVYL